MKYYSIISGVRRMNRNSCIELLAYLISSAQRIEGEPPAYAPLRLIEAARQLCSIMAEEETDSKKELEELIKLIDEGKHKNMTDTEAFHKMINAASEKVIDIIK